MVRRTEQASPPVNVTLSATFVAGLVFAGAKKQPPKENVLECALLFNDDAVFARGGGEVCEEWAPFTCPVLREVKRAALRDGGFDHGCLSSLVRKLSLLNQSHFVRDVVAADLHVMDAHLLVRG
jgi:hypothetical protein